MTDTISRGLFATANRRTEAPKPGRTTLRTAANTSPGKARIELTLTANWRPGITLCTTVEPYLVGEKAAARPSALCGSISDPGAHAHSHSHTFTGGAGFQDAKRP